VHKCNGRRIALHSFGCKLNQAEIESMALAFAAGGFEVVEPGDEADVHVVNTCTVTGEADRQLRQWLRSVRRRQPSSMLVAVGCAVERDAPHVQELADLVVTNAGKGDVVALVAERLEAGSASRPLPETAADGARIAGRNRAFVKIQEGCLAPCAYCIVPYVRRGETSAPLPEVVATARERIATGHRELVLTGTRPGVYRDGESRLSDVVRAVLDLPGLGRLRVSSLQPQELSPELLALWSDSRLCPHFHLSLQSGSGTVLRRMARGYTPVRFMEALADIRAAVPGAAVTTDIIVGFPGETDGEFAESVQFCERAGFSRIHVFPFSPRPGTRAAEMEGRLAVPVMKERVKAMLSLAQRSADAYVEVLRGRRVQALWEEETAPGSGEYLGTSENYLRLICSSNLPLRNVLEPVVVVCAEEEFVRVRRGDEDTGGCEAELEVTRR
jgi:threonylcarbamoyladenosine tRNA methylthiotransferase MtaB